MRLLLKKCNDECHESQKSPQLCNFIADGNVKVFEKGTTHILAEWKYSERNNSGKQLFSETSLSRQDVIESKTGNHVELEFFITSQDLF